MALRGSERVRRGNGDVARDPRGAVQGLQESAEPPELEARARLCADHGPEFAIQVVE